jgi:lipopolysaccharide/colanic/teichoic acid biosynthesis glycosyltransferase
MPVLIQRGLALAALAVVTPLLAVLAIAVRATSRGPAFHRATRVRPGGTFTLYKLRTMRVAATGEGPAITAAGDRRVTRLGGALRRTKLDELPQLWNVVRGDMALVGPRPEDPRYVDLTDPLHAEVFGALPGITGPTALAYRDEERVLAEAARGVAKAQGREQVSDEDIDQAYRDVVLPKKLDMDRAYLASRTARIDLGILGRTIGGVLGRTTRP